ncbi:MAG: hypothetical protein AB4911_22980 [Oscillochloridaceae bacterium umkhey_bin13]
MGEETLSSEHIQTGNIAGVGIAIGHGASVHIYGDIHYYPIVLRTPLREVFDPLIEDRVRLFGGRTAILERLIQHVKEQTGGYRVLTAPAGFGKTALMAKLIHGTPAAFAYHFFTNDPRVPDGMSESFFLCNVVQQMAEWHGHKEELPEKLNELRALYQHFLDIPLDRTRILVLDGMDEVTTWKLAPYVSRRLPNQLYIILTVRDVGQNWMSEYQLPAEQVTHLPLGGLDREEVRAVFRAAGSAGERLAADDSIVDMLVQRAAYQEDAALGADPLYVHVLAEDVQVGQLTQANLVDQPYGLSAYLERWWQEIKLQAGDRPTKDLFATLTVTLGPISRTDLECINPTLVDDWSNDYFADVLRQVRRFVIGDEQRGYSLVHPRLAQYLRLNAKIKVEPCMDRLLDYCARWSEHHSRYALMYYTQHLEEAQRYADIVSLCKDLRYLSHKTHYLTALDTEQDLNLAMQYANDDVQLHRLLRSFASIAHLVAACDHLDDVQTTLYCRFVHDSHLVELVQPFVQYLKSPYLRPLQPLPDSANLSCIRTLIGHTNWVNGCALSASGKVALSAAQDGTLKVWNITNGTCLRTLIGHRDAVNACALSADGTLALSASSDQNLKVWDTHSGEVRHTLAGHTGRVFACALSADGKIALSAAEDETLKVWDAMNGHCLHTLYDHMGWVLGCALSANGRLALSGSHGTILKLWDAASGHEIRMLIGHTDYVAGCALSADGTLALSASRDTTLKLWDTASGAVRYTLTGHTARVRGCSFSADGRLALSASDDKTLKVWDTREGMELNTLVGHTAEVLDCALNSDGTLALSASEDMTLRVWYTDTVQHTLIQRRHNDAVWSCAISNDGQYALSASLDGTLKVWGTMTGEVLSTLTGHSGGVRDCALSGDGTLALSTSDDGTMRVWDVFSGRQRLCLQVDPTSVLACALSCDGSRALTAAYDGTIKLWDPISGAQLQAISGHPAWVFGCTLNSDGQRALSASADHTLRVWDTTSGQCLHILTGHEDTVRSCALSTDGTLAFSASDDTTLRLWNTISGQAISTLMGHRSSVRGCALSANGKRAASVSTDRTLRLWDTPSRTCLSTLYVGSPLLSCAISAAGQIVVAGDTQGGVYMVQLVDR